MGKAIKTRNPRIKGAAKRYPSRISRRRKGEVWDRFSDLMLINNSLSKWPIVHWLVVSRQ